MKKPFLPFRPSRERTMNKPSHLLLSPAWRFVTATFLGQSGRRLGGVFLFHQAQVAADVEPEVAGEETRDALDVERAVGEVRGGVRRPLDDPDLARPAVGVVQAPAVVDVRD